MKAIKVLFAALILTTFIGIQESKAQALVIKNGTYFFHTGFESVESYASHYTMSTSENEVAVAKFQLSEGNPLIPEKGVNKLSLGLWEVRIFSDGRVVAVGHYNPSDY